MEAVRLYSADELYQTRAGEELAVFEEIPDAERKPGKQERHTVDAVKVCVLGAL